MFFVKCKYWFFIWYINPGQLINRIGNYVFVFTKQYNKNTVPRVATTFSMQLLM